MHNEIINTKEDAAVSELVKILLKGGVAAIPTETCYGLAADATNGKAVEKIYSLKGRRFSKPVSIFVSDSKTAEKYFSLSEKERLLIKKFMPGPLTLVATKRKNSNLASNLSKSGKIAFRISSHSFVRKFVSKFGKPITATSANISGKKENYSAAEITRIFSGKIDAIVDYGNLKRNPPSTVVAMENNKIRILRKGKISEKVLQRILSP